MFCVFKEIFVSILFKQTKVMRLAKKSKESEHKETIEGLTKLVCQARNPPSFSGTYLKYFECA